MSRSSDPRRDRLSRSPCAASRARGGPRRHSVRPHAIQVAARRADTRVRLRRRPRPSTCRSIFSVVTTRCINCAGHVGEGQRSSTWWTASSPRVELLPAAEQPVCWFLAGAALLDIDSSGRRGVDLPAVNATYWPHRVNFERLSRSSLDWRLLCPGPMVDGPAIGLDRLAHLARRAFRRSSCVGARPARRAVRRRSSRPWSPR